MCVVTRIILVLILTLTLCECYVHTLNGFGNHTLARIKRQSRCKSEEHQCGSGECIDKDGICNGHEDCRDGSDESSCANFGCPGFVFKCAYGACINTDLVCNGRRDCKDNSDETAAQCTNTTGPKPSLLCTHGQFECDDGSCIPDSDLCDGIANCRDGSDETVEKCAQTECPGYVFRCDYGACINEELKCNGEINCVDRSDEKSCPNSGSFTPKPPVVQPTQAPPPLVTTLTSSSQTGSCQLPPRLENGNWQVLGGADNLQPGQYVTKNTVLTFTCKMQFALYPLIDNKFAICDGTWSITPECRRICSAIPLSAVLNATCTLNGKYIPCTTPYDGIKAKLSCAFLYEDPSLERNPYRKCEDGSWDTALPQCEPVCGKKSFAATPLVVGGSFTKKGDYPWQVAIYRALDKKLICGGSIITPTIILTAAHCFESGTDASSYHVAAGTYYQKYKDPKDTDAQYPQIKQIQLHRQYGGGRYYYQNDIAHIILETAFEMTQYVLPVCLDKNEDFDKNELVGVKGVVTGWGKTTSGGEQSEILKELHIDYRPQAHCPLGAFVSYYTLDKMCAGLINQTQSVCEGDSGGGLSFPKGGRYYVRGIVSIGPRDRVTTSCDPQTVTLFTDVSSHVTHIQSVIENSDKKLKRLT